MLIADNAAIQIFQPLNKIRRILTFSFTINHLISIIHLLPKHLLTLQNNFDIPKRFYENYISFIWDLCLYFFYSSSCDFLLIIRL